MNKEQKIKLYKISLQQIKEILEDETDLMASMATINSILINNFEYYFWCGFYRVTATGKDKKELIIGPYQGTVGCLHIPFYRGVCGACATRGETIIVPNVHKFLGHIACDSRSNSEICLPVFNDTHELIAVLDIDSEDFGSFDDVDKEWLEKIVLILKNKK